MRSARRGLLIDFARRVLLGTKVPVGKAWLGSNCPHFVYTRFRTEPLRGKRVIAKSRIFKK